MKHPVYKGGKYLHYILAAAGIFWLYCCAHPVSPAGGPKDITPPKPVRAFPENYSTFFSANKIEVDFDEFIQLKDAAKEIFTSPPMVNKPEYTVRGKTLVVNLKEELRQDMTYVIYFGSSIVDITENNPIKGYSYVFSTGEKIDSLTITGKILNAFDLKPVENILFSIYSAGQDTIALDSMPLKIPPLSAIRTSTDGSFRLTNLPGGEFLVFALEDLNNNFYHDLPNERIGFLDSLVSSEYLGVRKDTTMEGDSAKVSISPEIKPLHPLTLYLFGEFDSTQRIISSSFTSAGSIQIAFRLPVTDIEIEPVNFTPATDWRLDEFSSGRDTLILWPLEAEKDTFHLMVTVDHALKDTLRLVRKRLEQTGAQKKKAGTRHSLRHSLNTKAGILEPEQDLVLTFPEPLTDYDFFGFLLYSPKDTVSPQVEISDSIRRKVTVHYPWEEDQSYRLIIPDSAITGLSGTSNDSISESFRTKALTDYGSLIVDFKFTAGNGAFITELLNDKDAVIRRHVLDTPQKITYKYLNPGTYRIKVTTDKNSNGKWDTGNYLRKQLPERITFFQKDITVRSNWELQEEWQLDQ